MLELQVKLKNCEHPNDVSQTLQKMIDEMQINQSCINIKRHTNGNHSGLGYVIISDKLQDYPNDIDKKEYSIQAHNFFVKLQELENVERVDILNVDKEYEYYFKYNR